MNTFSDTALITRVLLDDDRHAFGELVRRYQSDIRSLLRKLTTGDTDAADDLAQETFIRAYRHLSSFKGGSKFSTWLYRIAYNVFYTSKARQNALEYRDDLDIREPADTRDRAAEIADRMDLQRAMSHLCADEREALVLFYSGGMTHEEIADSMKRALGTVKTLILRAKEKLRKQMSSAERQVAT